MIIRCVHATGATLPPHTRGLYYTSQTQFPVRAGSTYEVFAMDVFQGGLTLLVADDRDDPVWLPAELFEVVDGSVPPGWEFAFLPYDEARTPFPGIGWRARWGYPEAARSDAHCDALSDRRREALAVFAGEVRARAALRAARADGAADGAVSVRLGSYSRDHGLHLEWAYGFVIEATTVGNEITIRANRAGLVSLAQHLLTIAGDDVPAGVHVHLEPGESLEDDSQPLVIDRLPESGTDASAQG